MTDRFEFCSPLGLLGRLVDALILKRYLQRFIQGRNAVLQQTAESEAWRKYLKPV